MFRPPTMDLDQRYIELNAIRQIRTLTRDERLEFEGLYNSRQAAANSPEVLAAKQENERLQQQLQAEQHAIAVEQNFKRVFNTVITFPDGTKKLAVDNTSNRNFLRDWAEGGVAEAGNYPDIVEWFKDVMKSPIARDQLAWEVYRTKQQKAQQRAADERARRAYFAQECREHSVSETEANFQLWAECSNPAITTLGDGRIYVMEQAAGTWENSEPKELSRAQDYELKKWAQERADAAKKAFDQKQLRLHQLQRAPATSENLAELKEMVAQERNQYDPLAAARERQIKAIQTQYIQDQQRGYREPLPRHFTQALITSYKFDARQMKEILDRYGRARVTARIVGISEIPDPNGGSGKISLE